MKIVNTYIVKDGRFLELIHESENGQFFKLVNFFGTITYTEMGEEEAMKLIEETKAILNKKEEDEN